MIRQAADRRIGQASPRGETFARSMGEAVLTLSAEPLNRIEIPLKMESYNMVFINLLRVQLLIRLLIPTPTYEAICTSLYI